MRISVLHELSSVLVDGSEESRRVDVELSASPRDVSDVLRRSILDEYCSVLVDGSEEIRRLDVELSASPRDVGDGLRTSVLHDPGSVAVHRREDRCVPLSEFRESVNDGGDLANAEEFDILL